MSRYTYTTASKLPRQIYNRELDTYIKDADPMIFEVEEEPVDTGLVDKAGNAIMRMPREKPMGFLFHLQVQENSDPSWFTDVEC